MSQPVFVHSSFRVSSTWFWTKFRACPQAVAYYEIFHERLATVTRAGLDSFNTECWDSRHPNTHAYFAEYEPLLSPDGGVKGFDRRMAYCEYVPDGGLHRAISEPARRHVRHLIEHARSLDRIPVLTCGRTLARIGGLRESVGGYHVLLVRNLWRQWLSYVRLTNQGTYYFLNASLATLANARHDPFLARTFDECVQREVCRDGDVILRFVSLQTFLRAFLSLHLYLYMAALPEVDLVIDVSALAREPALCTQAASAIRAATGLALDLSDVRDVPVDVGAALTGALRMACAGLVASAADALGVGPESASATFGARLMGDALAAAAQGEAG